MKGQVELDEGRFNRALWHGLMDEDRPHPELRHSRALSPESRHVLQAYQSGVEGSGPQAEEVSSR